MKNKSVKASKLKTKQRTLSAITIKNPKGKLSCKKMSGSKYLKVTSKGKIVVKKGTQKGTYKIKVKITAKGDSSYKSKSLTKTVNIKVK